MDFMSKKAQVTIFIIVAIIIVALFAGYFAFRDKLNIGFSSLDVDNVEVFVEECLGSTIQEGIFYISLQGGYYNTPNPKETYSSIEIPIYWDVDSENMPLKETIELELTNYVLNNLDVCLENFQNFKEQGYEIEGEISEISGKSLIGEKIVFNLDYPLTIEKDNSRSRLKKFSYTLDFDFMSRYNFARSIINEQENRPDMFPLSYVTNLAYENEFVFEIIDLDEREFILSLIFNEFNQEGYGYVYSFIINYGGEDE